MRMLQIAVALVALASAAQAQPAAYPTRPITVVVPYGPGGPTDTVGRIVAEAMGAELGERLIVENAAGAGGTVGGARVANAEKDGYTLLFNHIGMATAPGFYPNAPADPVRDFEPIGQVADVPMTLIGRKDLAPENLSALIAYVEVNGNKVTQAHAGPGTASYLCWLLLQTATGTEATGVSYNRGFAPAMIDLLGGRVDLICDQTSTTTNAITSREVRAYAVTTRDRLGTLPEVPTMDEGGVKDFELAIWHGFYAPKGTPKPVIERLSQALGKALRSKLVVERYGQIGAIPASPEAATPAGLATKLASEIARWTPVIKASQAK